MKGCTHTCKAGSSISLFTFLDSWILLLICKPNWIFRLVCPLAKEKKKLLLTYYLKKTNKQTDNLIMDSQRFLVCEGLLIADLWVYGALLNTLCITGELLS